MNKKAEMEWKQIIVILAFIAMALIVLGAAGTLLYVRIFPK
jgi:hypothetical protein